MYEAEFQCNVPDPRNSRKPLTCALYAQYKVWDIHVETTACPLHRLNKTIQRVVNQARPYFSNFGMQGWNYNYNLR